MKNDLFEATEKLFQAMDALQQAKSKANGPEQARAISVALTQAETAVLWAERAKEL